jgi:PBSX family phage terminase large subunit
MTAPRFQLRGGNWAAFSFRRSGEMVLAGPAGTGKTLANLLHLLWFGETYRGARMLIARKTRVSLTDSALVTWESNILGDAHPILGRPINRSNRREYRFPNGSVLVTGGMDRPDKILSTEWDLIYIPECTDLTLLDWETLAGRLRAGAGPYDLIFGDCNPTTPAHWVYKRHLAGGLTLIPTTHRDNPRFWDRAANDYTEAGRRYVVDRLGAMTGARRNRFLKGLWVAAEGLVYDGYDPAVHLLPHGWTPAAHWRRVWSIDWGFRDPLVVLFWAVDPDGRMYLYREFYRSNVRVESVAKWCAELLASGTEPRPSQVVADHDPENSATFTTHAGVYCEPADKSDRDRGLQETQGRFDVRPDGRPGIFFRPDSRCHEADAALAAEGRPTSLLEEIVGYQWKPATPEKPKDEPIEVNDHAMDAMRYAVRACPAAGGRGGLYAGEREAEAAY